MIRLLCLLMLLGAPATAQVHIDPSESTIDIGRRRIDIQLALSGVVPYRVYTLDDPRRLVVDFDGLRWGDISAEDMLPPRRVDALRFGPLADGWSRMVLDLPRALAVKEAGLTVVGAGAELVIALEKVSDQVFADQAGAPFIVERPFAHAAVISPVNDDVFVVVIDPGHGGIDSGADRDGVQEAPLMLMLADELAQALTGIDGLQVVLTRDADVFVPLTVRTSMARAAGADLFISLHADALKEDEAQGASVYTLGAHGGDDAARKMVERHQRGDLLSGVDLQATEDRVANVLMEMARRTTGPEGRNFADALVAQMEAAGVRLNTRPRREGQLAVLGAADFPSVLIEAGFLSDATDRAQLSQPEGRAPMVRAIAAAVVAWAADAD